MIFEKPEADKQSQVHARYLSIETKPHCSILKRLGILKEKKKNQISTLSWISFALWSAADTE